MRAVQANRNGSKKTEPKSETNVLLKTLIAFKRGDFSVRMPVDQTGVDGKIADALNDILELNQKMVSEFDAHQQGGGQGRQDHAASLHRIGDRSLGGLRGIGQQPDRRSGAAFDRSRARDRRGGERRSVANHVARSGRASAARRVSAHGARGEHHGGSVEFVRVGSDARGARSGYRRQAGRPGGGDRRRRNLEGSDGKRQLDGQQPDQSGPQHRRRDHGRGQGRFDHAKSRWTRAAKFWS